LIHGFTEGFSINNHILPSLVSPHNLKSTVLYPKMVEEKIDKELELGRVSGPYPEPPLESLMISPIGLQPKKEPGDVRIIHHLSYPRGESVNAGIPHEYATVQYTRGAYRKVWKRMLPSQNGY
jgi:hypothetical protein